MKAKRHKKINLVLAILLCSALPVLMLYSCKVQKVGPIDQEPLAPSELVQTYVSGQILDYDTQTGLAGVSITFGTLTTSTNANGEFNITSELTPGTYQLVASIAGYLNIYRTVEVTTEEDMTLFFAFKMKEENQPVDIAAATGGTITAPQTDPEAGSVGTISVDIPAGALAQNTPITVTPIPLSSSVQLGTVDPGYTPVNSVSLEPHGTTFTTAITVTVPNTLSPSALQGGIIVIKVIDPNTGTVELLNNANPQLSLDGTEISFSTTHFSNVIITSTSKYDLYVEEGTDDLLTLAAPATFTNGTDAKFDQCEEIGSRTGNLAFIRIPTDAVNRSVLTTNGGFTFEAINSHFGASYATLNVTLENKSISRSDFFADFVEFKPVVTRKRYNVKIQEKNVTTGANVGSPIDAGYVLIPKSITVTKKYTVSNCHDQG